MRYQKHPAKLQSHIPSRRRYWPIRRRSPQPSCRRQNCRLPRHWCLVQKSSTRGTRNSLFLNTIPGEKVRKRERRFRHGKERQFHFDSFRK